MTEWTRLISYLLYGLLSAILKKNIIKTPEIIFLIRLRALRLSLSLTHVLKKYLNDSFSFSYWKYSCTFVHHFRCFRPPARSFTHNSKEPSSIMPGHYKKIMPAQQPIRARVLLWPYKKYTYYLAHIILSETGASILSRLKYWWSQTHGILISGNR